MAVYLAPIAGVAAQFFDNNGNPLSGGKLYTYLAGTTTPAVTYTTNAGVTLHTNPIVLDSGGRIPNGGEVWLSDNISYKLVLKTSTDVTVATWDNIDGINSNFLTYTLQQEIQTATAGQTVFNLSTITYQPATGTLSVYVDGLNQYGPSATYSYVETDENTVTFNAGLHVGALVKFTTAISNTGNSLDASAVSYTPDGTGAVTTNVQTKLREYISVKDFGAVGDGITDDTTAIQAAVDSLVDYQILDLVGCSYAVSGITVDANNVTIRNGKLIALPSASIAVIKAASATSGVVFENLYVYINKAIITADDCAGIFFDQCTKAKAINCYVDGSKNNNYVPHEYGCIYGYLASKIDVINCIVINADKEGIMFVESDDIYIYDCEGRNSGYSNIGTSGGNRAIITGCRAFDSGASNITMNSQDSIVSNCLTSGNVTNNGIVIGHLGATQYAKNCLVSNNRILNSGGKGITITYGINVSIEGNVINNCTAEGIFITPNPSTNGGVTITGNAIDTCTSGIYCYGSAANQTVISSNTIRNATTYSVLVYSNGQANISNNIFTNVSTGIIAGGHVSGTTLSGNGITNLSINNNIFNNVTYWAILIKHLLEASVVGNVLDGINSSNTASVNVFTLENNNSGTASNMPTSIVFQSNTTKNTSASSKLFNIQANIKDATITRLNCQNNDLQDFSPSNIFTGTGFSSATAIYSVGGNQVGTDSRSVQISIASGTTTTIISNTNLLGRTNPVLMANDSVFGTLNVRITNYASGSITLTHSSSGSSAAATMSII